MQNSSVQYTQQITSLTTLEERRLIISLQLKIQIIKYLQKRTVQKITGQPYVYEMLLTLFWLLRNLFHYPHQSIPDVQRYRQSTVTPHSHIPLPRAPLSPSKEGEGLKGSSITFSTVTSFHKWTC